MPFISLSLHHINNDTMSERKRVNISLAPDTYYRLLRLQRKNNFRSLCEMMTAMANLMADSMEEAGRRLHDLPEDDRQYIERMFGELGDTQRVPDGTVPVKRRHRKL